jgi:tetratricopeptide (TPR) repeat protein
MSSPFFEALVATFKGQLDTYVGRYARARSGAQRALAGAQETENPWLLGRSHGILGWVMLAEREYTGAERSLLESLQAWRENNDAEYEAWALAALGASAHGLGRAAEARRYVMEALEIVTRIRAFIPLLHLMPVVSLVLVDEDAPSLKGRAVELWALANSHPFIANGQLFEDVSGRTLTTAAEMLAPEAIADAQARGRTLDWWAAADALVVELQELGWGEA